MLNAIVATIVAFTVSASAQMQPFISVPAGAGFTQQVPLGGGPGVLLSPPMGGGVQFAQPLQQPQFQQPQFVQPRVVPGYVPSYPRGATIY